MANGTLLSILPDKPIYKSLTCWGIVIFVAAQAGMTEACTSGLLGTAACATIMKVFTYVGGVMTVLGLRKAATSPNVA